MEQLTTPPTPETLPAPHPLPTAANMLGQAWRLFLERFNSILTITIIGMLVIFVVGVIFGGSTLLAPGNSQTAVSVVAVSVVVLVSLIVGIMQQSAIIAAAAYEQPITWQEAYKIGAKKFWYMLGALVVGGLLTFIGFILLIIPGIVLVVWFSVASYVVVLENKGVWGSLMQSKDYVRGRWWGVAWRILVLIVLVIIISIPVSAIAAANQTAGDIANLIFSIVVTPFAVCYMYVLYRSLRGEAEIPSSTNPAS